jgi:hypothetical protein
MKIGDRVKNADVTERSIPAYRAARGTVVGVSFDQDVLRVHWDSDDSPEPNPRKASTVCLA